MLEQGQAWWGISPFGLDMEGTDAGSREVAAQPAPAYRGDIEQAVADIRDHLAAGRRVVTVHQGHGPAQRMVEVLAEHDVAARLVEDSGFETLADARSSTTDGLVLVTQGCLEHGLVLDEPGLVILTGEDIAGQKATTRDMRKMPARRKKQIDPLELKAGDFVVHEQHGVGRFVEMRQREVHGAVREYLVLEYGSSALKAAATRPTSSTCRPTRSTRSPATSAASSPASTGSAAPTGRSARAARARRCARSRPS